VTTEQGLPLPRGRIKAVPEDFVVEEIPAYEPSGEGDHLYVRFTKRGLTTDDVAAKIARATGVPVRDVGIAGMKDKVAVTTQTFSLPIPPKGAQDLEARVTALAIDGVTVLDARRHTNKLRTGHLAGNRFTIVVRDIEEHRIDQVMSTLEEVGRVGLANAFGPQRFGRGRDNADKARAWLSGRIAAPRDARMKRLLFSALQAELFNRVLDARVAEGTWATPVVGDLVKRRHGHALFLWTGTEDPKDEAFPTGPMFGVKMRDPEGEPLALERRILAEFLGDGVDISGTRTLGEGTRRLLCLPVEGLTVQRLSDPLAAQDTRDAREGAQAEVGTNRPNCNGVSKGSGLRVCFVLPKGGYATSLLGTALALVEGADAASEGTPGDRDA
jgi:tRNA pseudouridine13 synthase